MGKLPRKLGSTHILPTSKTSRIIYCFYGCTKNSQIRALFSVCLKHKRSLNTVFNAFEMYRGYIMIHCKLPIISFGELICLASVYNHKQQNNIHDIIIRLLLRLLLFCCVALIHHYPITHYSFFLYWIPFLNSFNKWNNTCTHCVMCNDINIFLIYL